MKKTKWAVSLLSIIFTISMLFSTISASAATSFSDVGSRYKDAVDFLVEKGATSGKTEMLFGTHDNITRVDAAILLAKLLDLNTDVENSNFTDVPARGIKYVNALKAAGITSGKTAKTFDSYATITRGELAIWIQRAFHLEGSNSVSFTDVSSRYVEAVSALVANNITQGYSSTSFGTTDKATRGQYALFLYRASHQTNTDEAKIVSVSGRNGKWTITFDRVLENVSADDFWISDAEAPDDNEIEILSITHHGRTVEITIPTKDKMGIERIDSYFIVYREQSKDFNEYLMYIDPILITSAHAQNGQITVTLSEPVEKVWDSSFSVTQHYPEIDMSYDFFGEINASLAPDGKTVTLAVPKTEETLKDWFGLSTWPTINVVTEVSYSLGEDVVTNSFIVNAR